MRGQVVGGRLRAVEQQRPLVQRGTPWTQHVRRGRLVGHTSYVQHVIKRWLGLGGLDYSTKVSRNSLLYGNFTFVTFNLTKSDGISDNLLLFGVQTRLLYFVV